MKKLENIEFVLGFAFVLFSFMLASFGYMAYHNVEQISEIKTQEVITIPIEIEAVMIDEIPNLDSFLDDLGYRESSNRYDIVNQYGYMGKYQFGSSTLKGLGYNISKVDFLNSPEIQEEAMIKLLKANKHTLRRQIKKYDGKLVNGIFVTESGLLAAAHLVGPGSVRKWIRNGKEYKDGNGVTLVNYLTKFNGYQLNI